MAKVNRFTLNELELLKNLILSYTDLDDEEVNLMYRKIKLELCVEYRRRLELLENTNY